MSRQDPSPLRQASRQQTYADLVAEAESVFPDTYAPTRKVGLSSVGLYSVRELRSAHIAMFITPAMRAERDAARRAEFGPLWKDVHRGSARS